MMTTVRSFCFQLHRKNCFED